jgi:hypothetical protein
MFGADAVETSPERSPGSADESLVEAVVFLRPVQGLQAPDPAATREAAQAVLDAAQKDTGIVPDAFNVFDQLHSFSVRAPARFIQALEGARGVATVSRNELPESPLIKPVSRRNVGLPD